MTTKQELIDEVGARLGLRGYKVGDPGSSIPKGFFVDVADRLGLALDTDLSMPELGRAIVESAGLDCDSTHTPSGGGSTVTVTGLDRIRDAVDRLLGDSPPKPIDEFIHDAAVAVDSIAGKGHGRRYRTSAEDRRIIETAAMSRATDYLRSEGWEVEDVSRHRSYDLHCNKGNQTLHVEVKGTTQDGSEVLVTVAEIELARRESPHTLLYVLAGIQFSVREKTATGGSPILVQPWNPNDDQLRPVGFRLQVSQD